MLFLVCLNHTQPSVRGTNWELTILCTTLYQRKSNYRTISHQKTLKRWSRVDDKTLGWQLIGFKVEFCDRPVGLRTCALETIWRDEFDEVMKQLMKGRWMDTEDWGEGVKPAWKTIVFFRHPGKSCRFRKSPFAVNFTWKLDSDSLGDHSIVFSL